MIKKFGLFWAWLKVDKKRLIGAGVIVLVLVLGIWYLVSKNSNGETTYQTSVVEKGTLVSSVSASGNVLTTNTLSISTEASGVVKKVYVKDGDKVVAGQKLAEITLDSSGLESYAQGYSSYINALNGVNSANNSYRSAQASAEKVLDEVKGHDSDETLAQKETRTKIEVARDNAYDGLRQAQANLSSASFSFKSVSPIITAPFSGTIGSVALVEGMVLSSASSTTSINFQRVAVIKGDSLPVVSVSLSEVDVPKVAVGQKVVVTLDSVVDRTFTGVVATVDRVGTTTSNVTSYTANIKLDSSSDLILPNMAATANIILNSVTDVLIIPTTAIESQNGANYAKILKNGKVELVAVELGASGDDGVEVKSGIEAGVEVVTGVSSSKTGASSSSTKSVFSGVGGGGGMMMR